MAEHPEILAEPARQHTVVERGALQKLSDPLHGRRVPDLCEAPIGERHARNRPDHRRRCRCIRQRLAGEERAVGLDESLEDQSVA